jgi:crotonobetainyl-CoA:carnitine CoA-transferase CaiB-like acyl-CoA transferase
VEDVLPARLDALGLLCGAVGAVEHAVARLTGLPPQPVDPARVAAACASDRLLRVDGDPWAGFAPLSGYFRTHDGWLRTHANYPHHRERLLHLIGLPEDTHREAFAAAVAGLSAAHLEERAAAAGALAVRVRSEGEWATSPQGRAAAGGPLVAVRGGEVGRPRTWTAQDGRPLAGVRVLDLTRVIAGPVATRTLALLGAEVLRVDPPHLPEIEAQHLDTGQGKRTALADLRDDEQRARVQDLLDAADVLVTGYRPGAVERFGLRPPPALVHGRVTAWSVSGGPWAGRRGFDSLVQAASGIALVEGDGSRPGALPVQALDHASGYLLAAAVVGALDRRRVDGRDRDVSVALARTAAELLARPRRAVAPAPAGLDAVAGHVVTHGRVTTARPALAAYDDYPFPARPPGGDPLAWT